MSGKIPWQYSEELGGDYVYSPRRDEIILKSGRRFPRPQIVPAASLRLATYDEPDFSAIPSGNPLYSTTNRPGPAQDSKSSVPRYQSLPTSPLSTSPATGPDWAARFGNLNVNDASSAGGGITFAQGVASGPSSQASSAYSRNPRYLARVVTTARQGSDSRSTEILRSEVDGPQDTESLFPQYKQRQKKFYFVGKVFSMLWSEPAGGQTQATSFDEGISIGPYGEKVYSKIRRFVVIRSGDTYCNALPISTYGGRGVSKRGVNKSEHAIIYTGQRPNIMEVEYARRDEQPLRSTAIRVDPDSDEDRLDPRSRLNYGHPHTIQHNVKAKSCGKVPTEFVGTMILQFADVFGINPTGTSSRSRDTQSVTEDNDDGQPDTAKDNSDEGDDDPDEEDEEDDDDDDDDDPDEVSLAKIREAVRRFLLAGQTPEEAFRSIHRSLVQNGMSESRAAELVRRARSQSS